MPDTRADSPDPVRVLVCDDDALIRELLSAIVTAQPAFVLAGVAADGDAAVAQAAGLQPDVILLDLAMPGRTGLEALPALRQVAPNARIVVLSGFLARTMQTRVLELGAFSYVEKGNGPETIASAIHAAARASLNSTG